MKSLTGTKTLTFPVLKHIRHLFALLLISVTLWMVTLPGSAEASSQAEGNATHSVAGRVNGVPASLFKFSTTLPDDGTDTGGGNQEASATVVFLDWRTGNGNSWPCEITIAMPLRTTLKGPISASEAGKIAANVVNSATDKTMELKPSWIRGSFCPELSRQMAKVFKDDYQAVGGRIKKCQ